MEGNRFPFFIFMPLRLCAFFSFFCNGFPLPASCI
jgi:hypothetical protein